MTQKYSYFLLCFHYFSEPLPVFFNFCQIMKKKKKENEILWKNMIILKRVEQNFGFFLMNFFLINSRQQKLYGQLSFSFKKEAW